MQSFEHKLPADTPEAGAARARRQAQSPIRTCTASSCSCRCPSTSTADKVLEPIDPGKDVDGFHPDQCRPPVRSASARWCPARRSGSHHPGQVGAARSRRASTPSSIGRSNIVGKPMAQLLLRENCTVTIAHSRTRDLPGRRARAPTSSSPPSAGRRWCAATGSSPAPSSSTSASTASPEPDGKGKLVGDVDFAEAAEVAGAITPVPGGVGPMTIACLLKNTVEAALMQRGLRAKRPDAVAGLCLMRIWSAAASRRDSSALRRRARGR